MKAFWQLLTRKTNAVKVAQNDRITPFKKTTRKEILKKKLRLTILVHFWSYYFSRG